MEEKRVPLHWLVVLLLGRTSTLVPDGVDQEIVEEQRVCPERMVQLEPVMEYVAATHWLVEVSQVWPKGQVLVPALVPVQRPQLLLLVKV